MRFLLWEVRYLCIYIFNSICIYQAYLYITLLFSISGCVKFTFDEGGGKCVFCCICIYI